MRVMLHAQGKLHDILPDAALSVKTYMNGKPPDNLFQQRTPSHSMDRSVGRSQSDQWWFENNNVLGGEA